MNQSCVANLVFHVCYYCVGGGGGGSGGGVVDLTNDSGVEDELVDLTSPVSDVHIGVSLQWSIHIMFSLLSVYDLC